MRSSEIEPGDFVRAVPCTATINILDVLHCWNGEPLTGIVLEVFPSGEGTSSVIVNLHSLNIDFVFNSSELTMISKALT